MKNLPLLIVTLVGTLAVIVGVAVLFSRGGTSNRVIDPTLVAGDSRNALGATDAEVVVVEFSDFQCPACLAAEPLVKALVAQYENDIKFVYRHYPLVTIHPYAQLAAQATEVAADEGKFWEMHERLFATQAEWSALRNTDEVLEQFASYAEELTIDKAVFLEKIQSDDIKQRVTKDVADGTRAGVQATPTFYVNGQQVAAPQLLETVANALN